MALHAVEMPDFNNFGDVDFTNCRDGEAGLTDCGDVDLNGDGDADFAGNGDAGLFDWGIPDFESDIDDGFKGFGDTDLTNCALLLPSWNLFLVG